MSREQIVRDTAYAIWEAEGKPVGRDTEHWRQAEARVEGSLTGAGKPATTAGAKARQPAKAKVTEDEASPAEPTPPIKAAKTKAAPKKSK